MSSTRSIYLSCCCLWLHLSHYKTELYLKQKCVAAYQWCSIKHLHLGFEMDLPTLNFTAFIAIGRSWLLPARAEVTSATLRVRLSNPQLDSHDLQKKSWLHLKWRWLCQSQANHVDWDVWFYRCFAVASYALATCRNSFATCRNSSIVVNSQVGSGRYDMQTYPVEHERIPAAQHQKALYAVCPTVKASEFPAGAAGVFVRIMEPLSVLVPVFEPCFSLLVLSRHFLACEEFAGGHCITCALQPGWEERIHTDGRIFFVDHSKLCRRSTLRCIAAEPCVGFALCSKCSTIRWKKVSFAMCEIDRKATHFQNLSESEPQQVAYTGQEVSFILFTSN